LDSNYWIASQTGEKYTEVTLGELKDENMVLRQVMNNILLGKLELQ